MYFPDWLYTIDILFLALVIFFAAGGLRRGLSGELAHMLTLVVMLIVVCFFYPELARMAAHVWSRLPPLAVQSALITALALGAFLFFCLARAAFKKLFKAGVEAPVDHFAGLIAGALRGAMIGVALMAALSLLPGERLHQTLSGKSAVGGWVCRTLTPRLQPRLLDLPLFDRGEEARPSE